MHEYFDFALIMRIPGLRFSLQITGFIQTLFAFFGYVSNFTQFKQFITRYKH